MRIHPTAQVDPTARVGNGVEIGAYSVIGAEVEIGEGSTIGPHVVIEGPTRIGRDNRIFQFASVGAAPQDKKFRGERAELVIGDRNHIREIARALDLAIGPRPGAAAWRHRRFERRLHARADAMAARTTRASRIGKLTSAAPTASRMSMYQTQS